MYLCPVPRKAAQTATACNRPKDQKKIDRTRWNGLKRSSGHMVAHIAVACAQKARKCQKDFLEDVAGGVIALYFQ